MARRCTCSRTNGVHSWPCTWASVGSSARAFQPDVPHGTRAGWKECSSGPGGARCEACRAFETARRKNARERARVVGCVRCNPCPSNGGRCTRCGLVPAPATAAPPPEADRSAEVAALVSARAAEPRQEPNAPSARKTILDGIADLVGELRDVADLVERGGLAVEAALARSPIALRETAQAG